MNALIDTITEKLMILSLLNVHFLVSIKVVNDSDGFKVNKVFASKEELQARLCKFVLQNPFKFKTIKSEKNILIVTCVDNSCHWGIHVTKMND